MNYKIVSMILSQLTMRFIIFNQKMLYQQIKNKEFKMNTGTNELKIE